MNTELDVRHCRDIGVDAIISDRPELAIKTLADPNLVSPALPTQPGKSHRHPLRRMRRNP